MRNFILTWKNGTQYIIEIKAEVEVTCDQIFDIIDPTKDKVESVKEVLN